MRYSTGAGGCFVGQVPDPDRLWDHLRGGSQAEGLAKLSRPAHFHQHGCHGRRAGDGTAIRSIDRPRVLGIRKIGGKR